MTTKIFLASSAELLEDRKEFELLIGRRNKVWKSQSAYLELIVWEDCIDAMAQTRLQDEYNEAIRDCDIFVMLFFTKVGRYTAEEFDTAFGQFKATNRPMIYTYFKDAPIDTGSIDVDDLLSVRDFQNKLKVLGHFHTAYKNTEGLLLHFLQQLDKLAQSGFIKQMAPASLANDGAKEFNSVIKHYLQTLCNDLAGLKLGEINAATEQTRHMPLELADIYVPLDTTLHIVKDSSLAQWHARAASHLSEDVPTQRDETRPVSALEALAHHSELTLLGKPGGGKSTFGASVLLALAQAGLGDGNALSPFGSAWSFGPLLPLRVVLRSFAEQLAPGDGPARAGELWVYIGRELDATGFGLSAETMNYVQQIARERGVMVLFDGLDECGNEALRTRVLAAVREFMPSTGSASRFILTARPYAWPKGADPEAGVYLLADLNDKQIEEFIRRWYAAIVKRQWRTPADAERMVSDLLGAQHRKELRPLAQNLLLLRLMAVLHTDGDGLPEDRADLYNQLVELLMLRWNRQVGADKALLEELDLPGLELSHLRKALEQLAFEVHAQSVGIDGPTDIGEGRLLRTFKPLLGDSLDKAQVVVNYIEKRAGLLLGQGDKGGERQFTFPHRTFQDFLAACHLSALNKFPAECVRLARAAPEHWALVLPLAARVAKGKRGASAADELIGGRAVSEVHAERPIDAADWACALLAGAQLKEIGTGALQARPRTLAIVKRVAGWLRASLPVHPDDGGLPAQQRAQAGDLLSHLGDPRFDAQRLYLPAEAALGFVCVAADAKFCAGTRKADKTRIEEVAQFRAYLEGSSSEPGTAMPCETRGTSRSGMSVGTKPAPIAAG